jgi:hypothetical protein
MTDDKADSTQPIATPVDEFMISLGDLEHAALTQQVADLQAEVAKLREALEFVGDHLEGELGLLSADDYDIEYGTNETVIIAFNKVMEALQSGRRIQVWQD